jgi:CO dehydrogenase maturation factor
LSGPRLAVVGKGGAGKSTIAGTLARLLARRGRHVLALDSDMQPGLSFSLGAAVPAEPPLAAAAERDEDGRWRLRPGVGPVRAIRRYAVDAPDGVLLLQAGKASEEGLAPVMPAIQAFYRVVHRLGRPASLREWAIVGDLPAGPRQVAFGWAPYAERFLLVAEPTWQSVLAARRVIRVAAPDRRPRMSLVVNKARAGADAAWVEERLDLPAAAVVPLDEAVAAADRAGVALLDRAPGADAVRAIARLARDLDAGTLGP